MKIQKSRQKVTLGSTVWVSLLLVLLLCLVCPSSSHSQEASGATTACPTGVVGLCTPGTHEDVVSTTTTESVTDGAGTTTTETTTNVTTSSTITNVDTGNLLTDEKVKAMGRNQRFGGDMSSDWGGQGPASMPTGSTCNDLGVDRCAQITGSGNSTSASGVPGMGTTFIQTINVSSLGIGNRGGRTTYTIKVDKQDAQDRIYMHIRGLDGTTTRFNGTDILSESGVTTGFQNFSGGFDFAGGLTSLIVEVGGRDINLAIGPLFDDVTVNVLYNVVNTIVTQQITSIETFIATVGVADPDIIDVASDVFENNDITAGPEGEISITPIGPTNNGPDDGPSMASVELEIQTEMQAPEIAAPVVQPVAPPPPPEMQTAEASVETEIQAEMQNAGPEQVDLAPDPNGSQETASGPSSQESSVSEPEAGDGEQPSTKNASEDSSEPAPAKTEVAKAEPKEPEPEATEEQTEEPKAEPKESKAKEEKTSDKPKAAVKKEQAKEQKVEKKTAAKPKAKTKAQKKQAAKEKAAKKIVKKMGDKGKYSNANQAKTLVVMQVLGNTRTFFDNQIALPDATQFYTPTQIPGGKISDNELGSFMFNDANVGHNALTGMQYK
tara:strand:- start:721 stop:2544 length:1824 start_codon:yes stop_codon:yes gene_type:complete